MPCAGVDFGLEIQGFMTPEERRGRQTLPSAALHARPFLHFVNSHLRKNAGNPAAKILVRPLLREVRFHADFCFGLSFDHHDRSVEQRGQPAGKIKCAWQ
jgi:hypothetical protein